MTGQKKEGRQLSELQVFSSREFGSVRTLSRDGEPYFIASDVAEILGYRNPRAAVARHVDEEDRAVIGIHDGSQSRVMNVVNESGLYSLILSSKLPNAKNFKHWITAEVLPAVRHYGIYAVDEVLRDPEMLISALQALKEERQMARGLRETVLLQQEKIAELQPKANYYDLVLACPEAVPISIIAKDYGWSAIRMNRFLHEKGIQYRMGKTWLLYADLAGKGYTRSETVLYTDQNSETHHTIITKWTQTGRLMIYTLMKEAGFLPKCEENAGKGGGAEPAEEFDGGEKE